jgi:hypothetical protein
LKVLRRVVLMTALAACVAPGQALAAGSGLNAYEVKITGKSLQTLAQNGFDVTEGSGASGCGSRWRWSRAGPTASSGGPAPG